jgi:predicted deacetylase
MQLIVEIHDVTPALWPEVDAIVRRLASVGIERPTLLVAPEYEHNNVRWDMRQQPHYCDWLCALVEKGAEVVMHGLTHCAPRATKPTSTAIRPSLIRPTLMHALHSRGCAEFAHLDLDQARGRLTRGLGILTECGLETSGFVAPAWQQSEATKVAVCEAGFSFSAFIDSVLDVQTSQTRRAPCLSFAASHALIDAGKRLTMRMVEKRNAAVPLLRVALRPDDMRRPGLVAHIESRILGLLQTREPTSYRRFVGLRSKHIAA